MSILNFIKKKLSFPWYTRNPMDTLFNIWIENPLKTWWKARKYFKRPKISFHYFIISKYKNYPYASYKRIGKILDLCIEDVEWKDKYNSPRHERNPLIYIALFRKIGFSIYFNIYYKDEFGETQSGDSYYWEYLIDWLYYNERKTLKCYSTWIGDSSLYKRVTTWGDREDGTNDEYKPLKYVIPCVAMSLNKEGIKELKREINDNRK